MKRKRKLFKRPMKLYEKHRIEEENSLVKKYALKSKREIWKTLAKINYFRKRAMALAKASNEEREVFFNKLKGLGLNINSISDILGLQVEDLLRRRLPTVVAEKKLANTLKQARQMVSHKRVIVGENVIDAPSYIVPIALESKIKIKHKEKKEVKTLENADLGGLA